MSERDALLAWLVALPDDDYKLVTMFEPWLQRTLAGFAAELAR